MAWLLLRGDDDRQLAAAPPPTREAYKNANFRQKKSVSQSSLVHSFIAAEVFSSVVDASYIEEKAASFLNDNNDDRLCVLFVFLTHACKQLHQKNRPQAFTHQTEGIGNE